MKKLSVLLAAMVALLSLTGIAAAETASATTPVTIHAPARHAASPLALSCPSGDLCVWPVPDGSSSRCSWTNSDPDWQGGSVTCSWSSSRTVRAVYNHGTSSSYYGVCLYPAANYGGNVGYLFTQGEQEQDWPNVKIRSHKWVTGASCF